MSLFANLIQTYEKCSQIIGISKENNDGIIDERKTLLPIFHTTLSTEIHIVLDSQGNLVEINKDNRKEHIIIPCTETSANRSSNTAPHPLLDNLSYIDKHYDKKRYQAYVKLLSKWKDTHIKIHAIYNYLVNNSVVADLKEKKHLQENEKLSEIGVRFSVEIPGDNYPNVWKDATLRDLWIDNQLATSIKDKVDFDYLAGNMSSHFTRIHPRYINPKAIRARLISCNDGKNFTYKGRFRNREEALKIDKVSSQKAHQLLKWLIANSNINIDTQAIVIWAVSENASDVVKPFGDSLDIFEGLSSYISDSTLLQEAELTIDTNYAKKVALALKGYSNAEKLKKHSKTIAIAILDAATSGRMSIVFYQELPQDKYLENIANWHQDSAWYLNKFKRFQNEKGEEYTKRITYQGCPSFDDITFAVYGRPRSSNDKSYLVIKKKIQKQLLECMFGNFPFPKNFVDMATNRASCPMSFTDDSGALKEFEWRSSIDITCALYKKYIKQKEDIDMELEVNRQDRDYLFGRLLAVADKVERVALYQKATDSRATNAMRLMSSFSTRPSATWGVLWQQLIPYLNQLKNSYYYQSLIDSIMILFKSGEYEDNNPLTSLYLLGFSAQNRALTTKKEKMEDNVNGDIEEQN